MPSCCANDDGPRDTIVFNIPGTGVHTIRPPASGLPGIGQPIIIDGTTQPGYSGTPLIEIDGTTSGNVNGLALNGGNSIIRGLAINRFAQAGLFIPSAGNTIESNFIGTDPTGTLARPNAGGGIVVRGANNTIGGTTAGARNLIAGNNNGGININTGAATGNLVAGNFIGTNASGTAALPNGNNGINIYAGATRNTVGGSTAAARNIISGNLGSGIRLQDAATTGNDVRGNYVGTNLSGTSAIPNGFNGVEFGFATAGNTVGGPQPVDGNLLSGNSGAASASSPLGAGGNTALFNLIGTDATLVAVPTIPCDQRQYWRDGDDDRRHAAARLPLGNAGNGVISAAHAVEQTVSKPDYIGMRRTAPRCFERPAWRDRPSAT